MDITASLFRVVAHRTLLYMHYIAGERSTNMVLRHNYALQRTMDAPARGALRRVGYFAPERAVTGLRAVAERGR